MRLRRKRVFYYLLIARAVLIEEIDILKNLLIPFKHWYVAHPDAARKKRILFFDLGVNLVVGSRLLDIWNILREQIFMAV